jgi:hypothetical protein
LEVRQEEDLEMDTERLMVVDTLILGCQFQLQGVVFSLWQEEAEEEEEAGTLV